MTLDSGYEKVYLVIHSYDFFITGYDRILTGVADYNGKPHFFECILDKEEGRWIEESRGIDTYLLSPIDSGTFQLVLEKGVLTLRWESSFYYAGQIKKNSEEALSEDRRRAQLNKILDQRLVIDPETSFKVKGDCRFVRGLHEVSWSLAE